MKKLIMLCLLSILLLQKPAFSEFNFIDNGNGTVTDTRTGLVWLKNANPCDRKNWYEALAYCSSLASGTAGLTDGSVAGQWRLPSKEEMEALGTDPPATWEWEHCPVPWTMPGVPFTNVQSFFYWSSSTAPDRTEYARPFVMNTGYLGYDLKESCYYYVWPVRETLTTTTTTSISINNAEVVFYANFNSGVPPQFSGVTTIESVQGFNGLGTGTNVFDGNFLRNQTSYPASKTVLTLTGLPPHTSIDLNFLLAILESWDGLGPPENPDGPDYFNVVIDGTLVFSETFDFRTLDWMTYKPPAGVLLALFQTLYGNPDWPDGAYNMGLDPKFHNIPHTSSSLVVEWFASGGGWQGGYDESWAIDNVEVIVHNTYPLVAIAGGDQVVFDAVHLDGSGSYDTDGEITSYHWDLIHRENSANNRTASGVNPTITDLAKGFYDVTLTVTDNTGYTGQDTMLLAAAGPCELPTTTTTATPTNIELSVLDALHSNEKVLLRWRTESEPDNAGFNIWRAEGFQKLNEALIPAMGSPIDGAAYNFVDEWVLNGKRYFYLLEDIDINGISTFHGPVKAVPRWWLGVGW